MKTLIASALIASAAFAGAANAADVVADAHRILPNADFSALTDTQVAQVNNVATSEDNTNQARAAIRAIID